MSNDDIAIAKVVYQGVKGVVIQNGCFITCISTPNSLTIPKEIISLEDGCLSGQDNLEYIHLKHTLQNIGESVLANCPNLKVIYCSPELEKFSDKLRCGNKGVIKYVIHNK